MHIICRLFNRQCMPLVNCVGLLNTKYMNFPKYINLFPSLTYQETVVTLLRPPFMIQKNKRKKQRAKKKSEIVSERVCFFFCSPVPTEMGGGDSIV